MEFILLALLTLITVYIVITVLYANSVTEYIKASLEHDQKVSDINETIIQKLHDMEANDKKLQKMSDPIRNTNSRRGTK